MNKKRVLATLALALAGATGIWYHGRPPDDGRTLRLYGNVDLRQVSLAFNASERIARLDVQEGERVRAGQVLGELDKATLRLRLAQAQAQADAQQQILRRLQAGSRPEELAQARAGESAARAEAGLAARQLERLRAAQRDTGGRAISQQDVDGAQARHQTTLAQLEAAREGARLARTGPRREDIAQAQALLEASRANAALLRHQLDEADLRAPIAAVVRARLLEPGDMASPQRPVYTLAIADPKWVRAYVNEADLGRIKPGMAASISIDGAPASPLRGRVGYISSVAEFTPKTVQTEELRTTLVYEVRVLAQDPADVLRLGMPATVRLDLAQARP